jgi:hypothetical protein
MPNRLFEDFRKKEFSGSGEYSSEKDKSPTAYRWGFIRET